VGGGVFARGTAKHCAEVIDEMGLVVPTEANREVGVIDAGMAFDHLLHSVQPIVVADPVDQ
jgi:hypothetical protein